MECPSTARAPSRSCGRGRWRWGPGSAAAKRGGERYRATPVRRVGYLMLNAGRPLFRSRRVRKAVSRVLDRAALAQQFGYTPSSQLLPPRSPRVPALAPRATGEPHHAGRTRGNGCDHDRPSRLPTMSTARCNRRRVGRAPGHRGPATRGSLSACHARERAGIDRYLRLGDRASVSEPGELPPTHAPQRRTAHVAAGVDGRCARRARSAERLFPRRSRGSARRALGEQRRAGHRVRLPDHRYHCFLPGSAAASGQAKTQGSISPPCASAEPTARAACWRAPRAQSDGTTSGWGGQTQPSPAR